ncbi:hypothetical protein CMO89_00845 [Candidatus Woesearchaeota archaeon]|nr:hypothetical protein [Candidatus Woesearchaeota archaeon]|tara:strand:- start:15016 stop:15522 length:507 start_codon:yes stop_codon:yes gene_type:complete
MERFQELRDAAKKKLNVADHMLFMTYPLVKDTKLLLAIMENVFLAMSYAMSSVLHYEKLFKRLPSFHESFENRFSLFREKCISKYGFNKEHINIIKEIKDIIVEHKNSPMEFVRKDRFVICSSSYRVKTIELNQIKKYVAEAKLFVKEVNNVTSRNEEIFKQRESFRL